MSSVIRKSKDIILLSYYVKMGNVFGIFPPTSGSSLLTVWRFRCFALFVQISIFCISIHRSFMALTAYQMNTFDMTFLVARVLIYKSFLVIIVDGIIRYESDWEKLLENIARIEKSVLQTRHLEDITIWKHVIMSFIGHLILMLYTVADLIEFDYSVDRTFMLSVFLTVTSDSQLLLIMVTMYEFCCLMRRRYDHLINTVNSIFCVTLGNIDATLKTEEIKKTCVLLHDTIRRFNNIFGKYITWIILNAMLKILVSCNMVLTRDHPGSPYATYAHIAHNLIQSVYVLILIMSCDSVEKSGIKLKTSCCYLQPSAENAFVREELRSLTLCTKQLLPRFSASGFFQINQSFITGYLSGVTAYIILIIQSKI